MVTRYQNIDRDSGVEGPMSEDAEGEWVDWDDYQRLASKLRKLRAFVEEIAGEGCLYEHASPAECAASRKHYQCEPCKAQETLND